MNDIEMQEAYYHGAKDFSKEELYKLKDSYERAASQVAKQLEAIEVEDKFNELASNRKWAVSLPDMNMTFEFDHFEEAFYDFKKNVTEGNDAWMYMR